MALALSISLGAHLALLHSYQPQQPTPVTPTPLELRIHRPPPSQPAPEPEPAERSQPPPESPTETTKPTTSPDPPPQTKQEPDARAGTTQPGPDARTIRRQALAAVRRAKPEPGQPLMPRNWTAPVLPQRPGRPDLLEPLFYTGPTGTTDEWQDLDGTYHVTAVLSDGTRLCGHSVTLMPMTNFEASVLAMRTCGRVRGDGDRGYPLQAFHGQANPVVEHFRALHGLGQSTDDVR